MHLDHLLAYRQVLWMLVQRAVKTRYAQTWLGIGWVVFQPLLTVMLFSLIFGKWIQLPADGVPYTLFAFSGLVAWVYLSSSIQKASSIMQSDSRLITKIYFPRILLPLSSLIETLIDFGVLICSLLILMGLYGVAPSWKMVFFPFLTLPLFFLSFGVASTFSSLGIYYRDFMALLPFFLQTWMYCSPIVYSVSIVPQKWLWLYRLNPMVGILETFRWCFLKIGPFPWMDFMYSLMAALVIAILGSFVFHRLEKEFADIL